MKKSILSLGASIAVVCCTIAYAGSGLRSAMPTINGISMAEESGRIPANKSLTLKKDGLHLIKKEVKRSAEGATDSASTNRVQTKVDLLSGLTNYISNGFQYDNDSNTLTFNSSDFYYYLIGVDTSNSYYIWYGKYGVNHIYSGTVHSDKEISVIPTLWSIDGSSLTYALGDSILLNSENNFTANFEIKSKSLPEGSAIGFGFMLEQPEGEVVNLTATNNEFYYVVDAYKTEPWTAECNIPGLGVNDDIAPYCHILHLDDGATTLGLYTTNSSQTYIIGINTTASEVTIPDAALINDQVHFIRYLGNGTLDLSNASSLTSLYLPYVEHLNADISSSQITDLYIQNGFYINQQQQTPQTYLHIPVRFLRESFNNYGFKRVLVGEETPEYPETTKSHYVIKDENGDYFGIYYRQIADEIKAYGITEIFTEKDSITLPTHTIGINPIYLYPLRYLGLDQALDYGTLCANAPNLKSLIFNSSFFSEIMLSWRYSTNLKELHMTGEAPISYWAATSDLTVYVRSQEYYNDFINNNSWKNAKVVPEGWDFELYTVNVARKGEFAQTYIEMTDADWSLARNVKVTGELSETDLSNIKKLTNLSKLDLSEAVYDALPTSFMYSHSALQEVILPDSLKSISDNAFYNCKKLSKVVAPGVEMVGRSAFYNCPKLTDFNPNNLKVIEESAFSQCSSYSPATLEDVTYLGPNSFYCSGIKSAIIPQGISKIENYTFQGCNQLENVILPEGLHTIGFYAFTDCTSLTNITIPSSLKTIQDYAFTNCSILPHIDLPEGLTQIGFTAFDSCRSFTELTIPSTVKSIGSGLLRDCVSLTTVKCKAVIPPTANGSFLSGVDLNHCTLYVAPFAIDAYRAASYWNEFYIVKSLNEPIKNIYIDRQMSFNLMSEDNAVLQDNPNLTLDYDKQNYYNRYDCYVGELTASGDGTLSAGIFSINQLFRSRNSNYDARPTLINNAENMRADSVVTTINFEKNRWHFISFLYDVAVEDIVGLSNTDFVIREYDGANRAAGEDNESNWKDVPANATLTAGKGYIIQTANNTTDSLGYTNNAVVQFPSRNTITKNNIFTSTDVEVALEEYPAEFAHNRSWNLVGNPYPCYFDMHYLAEEFYTPIILWRSTSYQAYSPVDDDVILCPNEAFFVQRPIDVEKMVFGANGRMHRIAAAYNSNGTPATQAPVMKSSIDRSIFNFNIEGCGSDDRARIVINEDASADYEINRDASKFFAESATGVEIYVDGSVKYAISERPLGEGKATLGVRFAEAGLYTLSLSGRAIEGWSVILTDNVTGNSTDLTTDSYSFEAKAGESAGRFSISFQAPEQSSLDELAAENGNAQVRVVNTLGVVVFDGTLNDFKASATTGVYVVIEANKAYKVVVK